MMLISQKIKTSKRLTLNCGLWLSLNFKLHPKTKVTIHNPNPCYIFIGLSHIKKYIFKNFSETITPR